MKNMEKFSAIISLLTLILCFVAGFLRNQDLLGEQITAIIPNSTSFETMSNDIYAVTKQDGEEVLLVFGTYPGYAGPMRSALVVSALGIVEAVSIVESPDTQPYLKKIIDARIPNAYLNSHIEHIPIPDSVSGATLSSVALKEGIKHAAYALMRNEDVRAAFPQLRITENSIAAAKINSTQGNVSLSTTECIKIILVFLFFLCALYITSKKFLWNKQYARYVLLTASVILLGFLYGTQFSLATIAIACSGVWLIGLASYAPLICLILAIGIFLYTKKNIYCMFICPFGAVQEGISCILHCKAPQRTAFMQWTSRFFALGLMCFALYFSQASAASYEPFGKTFNFVGSLTLFALSSTIIVLALFVKKPWCHLFCPITPFFDYIYFWRKWFFSIKTITKQQ